MLTAEATGVCVICPTPFLPDGALDERSAASMTEAYVAAGATGLTILGIMGEAPKLSVAESVAFARHVVQRVAGRGAAKHRMDVGCEMRHVWHHDHDVARAQAGVIFEPVQHLIVQHFHLALGAVALHPLNAGVVGLALVLAFCRGAQVQDI